MTEHVPSGDTGMKPRRPGGSDDGDHPGEDMVQAKRPRRLVTVTLARPRCPRCGCIRLHKYRSIRDQGDGSALWWVRCTADGCGQRFRVLLE
jgi:hypothetical protein